MQKALALAALLTLLVAACSAPPEPEELLPQTYPRGVDAGPGLGQLPRYGTDGGIIR